MFLFANIFTGVVNLTIDTKAQSDWVAHLVMTSYLASMCFLSFIVYEKDSVRKVLTGHIIKPKSA